MVRYLATHTLYFWNNLLFLLLYQRVKRALPRIYFVLLLLLFWCWLNNKWVPYLVNNNGVKKQYQNLFLLLPFRHIVCRLFGAGIISISDLFLLHSISYILTYFPHIQCPVSVTSACSMFPHLLGTLDLSRGNILFLCWIYSFLVNRKGTSTPLSLSSPSTSSMASIKCYFSYFGNFWWKGGIYALCCQN